MKVRSVAIWAVLGMATMSAGALAIPVPPSNAAGVAAAAGTDAIRSETGEATAGWTAAAEPWHFTAGRTLTVDSRLGHASLPAAPPGSPSRETYLFASVTGADTTGNEAPPLNLALVIDRSGSMAGVRIANAIAAAVGAVERMREGDSVTVVSFDTVAKVVVPPTRTTASSRAGILAAIRSIRLGGDTCISCGLDEAMRQLEQTSLGRDQITRMILLSDGEPTHGVKDVPGFRAMSSRMRDKGFAITTIGVDTQYEEKVMAAIASESNGHHFFVANPSGLPAIFAQEFESLVASVATEGELAVELAPGVQVDEVFDRTFRREGQRIMIPFGSFSAKQEKTVLMRLRVPADHDGRQPVAQLKLAYRDLLQHTEGACGGELALFVKSDGTQQKTLDPFVEARVERSRTAQTLQDANKLVGEGRVAEAKVVLARQRVAVRTAQTEALANEPSAPSKKSGRGLVGDFDEQEKTIAAAQANLAPVATATPAPGAPPPQASPAARAATRGNAADAFNSTR